jgi:hypothetical protein
MEAFNAILERRLQLTVRTLSQAVRTPSSILVTTFYSNIGLGRNWRRWKATEKLYELIVRTAIRFSQKAPVRMETSRVRTALQNFPELLFGQGNSSPSGQPRLPSGRACQRLHFLLELGLRHRIRW